MENGQWRGGRVRIEGRSEEDLEKPVKELRVASATGVPHLATALLRFVEEGNDVELACMGVAALAQAVKAVARANGEVAQQGNILTILPAFSNRVMTLGEETEAVERTVVRLCVHKHRLRVLGPGNAEIQPRQRQARGAGNCIRAEVRFFALG